jgi:hypothetical protein
VQLGAYDDTPQCPVPAVPGQTFAPWSHPFCTTVLADVQSAWRRQAGSYEYDEDSH